MDIFNVTSVERVYFLKQGGLLGDIATAINLISGGINLLEQRKELTPPEADILRDKIFPGEGEKTAAMNIAYLSELLGLVADKPTEFIGRVRKEEKFPEDLFSKERVEGYFRAAKTALKYYHDLPDEEKAKIVKVQTKRGEGRDYMTTAQAVENTLARALEMVSRMAENADLYKELGELNTATNKLRPANRDLLPK